MSPSNRAWSFGIRPRLVTDHPAVPAVAAKDDPNAAPASVSTRETTVRG